MTIENRLEKVCEALEFSKQDLIFLTSDLHEKLKLGLIGDCPAGFKQLPTWISTLPSGSESGEFWAIDLGGSNLRVALISLDGKGNFDLNQQKHEILKSIRVSEIKRSDELFDFIAQKFKEFQQITKSKSRIIGFTFSYPVNQTSAERGTLIQWNKSIKCDDAIGKDVVELLSSALSRRNMADFKVRILINDTVGTLLAHKYKYPKTKMSVIMGTGTNAAYIEKVSNIKKINSSAKHMVMNVEWGAYGGNEQQSMETSESILVSGCSKEKSLLKFTRFDHEIDYKSLNRGKQIFEKMSSGMYLGDLATIMLSWVLEDKNIQKLSTSQLSQIEFESRNLTLTSFLDQKELAKSTLTHKLAQRSANFIACGIAAIFKEYKENQENASRDDEFIVAFDGAFYEHFPGMKNKLMDALDQILDPNHKICLHLAKDQSIIGSATACAALEGGNKI